MPRYIYADALKSILNSKADMSLGTPKQVFHNVAKMVDLLPTADVAEVRHGLWKIERIWNADMFFNVYSHTCTADGCGYTYKGCAPLGYNYCPNCGAKMDAERSEQ